MPYIGQLPGLWWDESSGKYLPLSKKPSKPLNTPVPSAAPSTSSYKPPQRRNPQRYTDAIGLYDEQLSKRLRSARNIRRYTQFYPIRAAAVSLGLGRNNHISSAQYLDGSRAVIATSQINSQLQLLDLCKDDRRFILESSPGSVESVIKIGSVEEVGWVRAAYRDSH